jgi:hypothetical protein
LCAAFDSGVPINLETTNCQLAVNQNASRVILIIITCETDLSDSNNNPNRTLHARIIGACRLDIIPAGPPSVRQPSSFHYHLVACRAFCPQIGRPKT